MKFHISHCPHLAGLSLASSSSSEDEDAGTGHLGGFLGGFLGVGCLPFECPNPFFGVILGSKDEILESPSP